MRKGFTLMEMMIVLLAIALLVLLTIPNISKVTSIIRKSGCEAQLTVVDAAILQYQIEYQSLPSSIDVLIAEDFLRENHKYCQHGSEISIKGGRAVVD